RASYDVTDTVTAFVGFQWANSHAVNTANPNRRLGNNTVSIDNAFLPESIRTQMQAQGLTSFRLGTTNADMGRFVGDYQRTLRRVSGGLDGDFSAFDTDWTWN